MPEFVHDLLLRASKAKPYAVDAYGKTAVYEIPDYPDLLLRVEKRAESFCTRLEKTTALHPVYLCDRDFGQKLLVEHRLGYQIISKRPGDSLLSIFKKAYHTAIKDGASSEEAQIAGRRIVLEKLHALPQESLVKFMDDTKALTHSGLEIDAHWGNILLHENNLHIIDVNDSGAATLGDNCLDNLAHNLIGEKPGFALSEIWHNLKARLADAANHVGVPVTAKEAESMTGHIELSHLRNISKRLGTLPITAELPKWEEMLKAVRRFKEIPHL